MRKKFTFFFCIAFLFSTQVWGQTWNLTPTMTAVLDSKGCLTISTTKAEGEAMPGGTRELHLSAVCNQIHSLIIKDKVTSIGHMSFPGCENLTSVTISNSVVEIESYAFSGCISLTSVTIPNSIKTIGGYVFNYCKSLTSVTIPNSVTSIWGSETFGLCFDLKDVTVNWTTPLSVPANSFRDVDLTNVTLHVPAGTKTLYEAADVWKDFGKIVEMGKSVTLDETQQVGSDGKGTISLNLSIPSDVTLTGSFEIQFPEGMKLNEQLTVLSLELSGNFYLAFSYKGDNTWLIEIKSNAMRSSKESEYQKIMDIAYTVDENLPKGAYEAIITNLDFLLNDGTSIKEDLLTVQISVERYGAAIENIGNTSFHAYFINNMLRIESTYVETITIYSAAGVRLYSLKKDAGSMDVPVSSLPGSVYIIKGSVSGTIKLIKN